MRWVTATLDDVPAADDWLGPRERQVLRVLEGERRRTEWRLGRWTAKRLVPGDAEILPAVDGAPEAWVGDELLPLSLSIAHRHGRAFAATGAAETPVGCDLEPLRDDRDVRSFVAWEAAAKALRRGLLSGERPRVELDGATFTAWWPDGREAHGEWWVDDGWAFALARARDRHHTS